jgi:hypothetical protein
MPRLNDKRDHNNEAHEVRNGEAVAKQKRVHAARTANTHHETRTHSSVRQQSSPHLYNATVTNQLPNLGCAGASNTAGSTAYMMDFSCTGEAVTTPCPAQHASSPTFYHAAAREARHNAPW